MSDRPVTGGMRGPVASGERIAALDWVRGWAVMGIALANMPAFGQPFSAVFYPPAFLSERPDDGWLWLAQLVLIDGKLRGLFTLLFGAGILLFLERARTKGEGRGLQARRLGWLLLFGVAHFVLLWRGDILIPYAIAGLVALLFVQWTGRRLVVVGVASYLVGAVAAAAMWGFLAIMGAPDAAADPARAEMHAGLAASIADTGARDAAEGRIIASGDYGRFVSSNFAQLPGTLGFNLFLTVLETLPLILVGMGLFRLRFFDGAGWAARRRFWVSLAALAAGAVATFFIGLGQVRDGFTYFGALAAVMGTSALPRLPMILGLAGLLVLAHERTRGRLAERVRATGRMAFSNYLLTSFIMLWVFHGFGLGLFGALDRLQLYAVAAGMAVLMLAWSKPWLDRFRYGPLEWLWRCLTYGRVVPLRGRGDAGEQP